MQHSDVFTEAFVLFVDRQDPSDEYRYYDGQYCAVAQFLKSQGHQVLNVAGDYYRVLIAGEEVSVDLPPRVADAVALCPHTWGALAERLRS